MDQIRSGAMTGLAAALVLAASLPAAAQVVTSRQLTLARPPLAAEVQVTPEQRQWVAEQVRNNPGYDPARLDAAARERFAGQPEASYEYLIQLAARLAAGDSQEQQRQQQARLRALEAQKRALRSQVEQKESEAAGKEAASPAQKEAAQDAYLKTQSLRMPAVTMDRSSGTARLSDAGHFAEPASLPDAPADSAGKLSPSLHAWVKSRARAMVNSGVAPDPNQVADDVRMRLSGQDFDNADIEAITFLVMMEASRQAQEDLREIMAQAQAITKRKAEMREAMQSKNAAAAAQAASSPESKAICVDPPCKPQLVRATPAATDTSKAKDDMDSLSDMGEMESMRLQMAMDRRSKLMEALSNILKKSSDTASTITQNLK